LHNFAKSIRAHALEMTYRAKASHIGSCFSIAEILAVLYGSILRIDPLYPKALDRDRLIISKGHAAASVYAALALCGFFPLEQLKTFCESGSDLLGHVSHEVPGVEYSSGSLGHGLSIGCGMALAAKQSGENFHTYVLLSDGELNEGSTWEAILFAGHHKLSSLTMIVDCNRMQALGATADILELEPLGKKLQACAWEVIEVDGHNEAFLEEALKKKSDKPKAVIGHTIKGKGIAYMENSLTWHYKNPTDLQASLEALELEKVATDH